MAKIDILDILRSKQQSPLEFDFDSLWIPPMYNYLTPQDIEALHKIATSVRLSSRINDKYEMINNIMIRRGFKRFSAGTNRVVYSFLEDNRFLAKIAVDKVGMQDNPMEYKNQFLLKPYVTKMFYHSPCGTVGFVERVLPIKNKAEFKEIADDVFDILIHKILGKYVMEDIGTKYFMNWGVRIGSGPCLLDFPYLYKLDGKKLYCTKTDPANGLMCNGEIDYDAGFNHLVCNRCGKVYLASDLRDDSVDNKIIIKKGGLQMQVVIKKGDTVIASTPKTDDVIRKPEKKENNSEFKACIHYPSGKVVTTPNTMDKERSKSNGSLKINATIAGINSDSNKAVNNNDGEKEPETIEVTTLISSEEDGCKTINTEASTNLDDAGDANLNPDINLGPDSDSEDEEASNNVNVAPDNDSDDKDSSKDDETDNDSDDKDSSKDDETDNDADDDISDDDKKDCSVNDDYDKFDDEPVRVKTRRSTPRRDDKGRFISTNKKNNKAKSNFIPSSK